MCEKCAGETCSVQKIAKTGAINLWGKLQCSEGGSTRVREMCGGELQCSKGGENVC